MHLHWERSSNSTGDCSITSLSWMGKVPEEIPEEDGWKLSRNNYYQEGWLATANLRGVVGVTFTTSFCGGQAADIPARTNYNLRGHRSEVTLVKWNEPYQKLASCDSTGIIFVWIKYEGRWSIELINDRSTPVNSFAWSHDGRMALICYQDGFVLVGSVAGQRYWSTMLPPDVSASCGVWTPDDQQVYIATVHGSIMIMDVHGNPVTRVELTPGVQITALTWNCEKFNMEEREESQQQQQRPHVQRDHVLALCFRNGDIKMMRGYDDVSPVHIHTGFQSMHAEWSNSGEFLAVAGKTTMPTHTDTATHVNRIKFYRETGSPVSTVLVPFYKSPVTALTWGHNDKRLFVATGAQVHIGWVNRRIGSLQLLCRLKIHKTLQSAGQVDSLPLPCRVRALISSLFTHSIKCHIPDKLNLRQFVCRPPRNSLRHYCTMIRHGDELTGTNYTIYLEHLGGFLPVLKGKKTSKLRPEFVIFDPSKDIHALERAQRAVVSRQTSSSCEASDTDTDMEEMHSSIHSPRLRRRRRRRRRNQPQYFGYLGNEEVDYINNLPEEGRIVEITSNIWGTKFKIQGLHSSLPPLLGQITYKASLLHLQPRQMRLILTELRDEVMVGKFQSSYSYSEDEEDTNRVRMEDDLLTAVTGAVDYPVVAPLPSISNRLSVADFQRISPTRVDYGPTTTTSNGNNNNVPFHLPEVAITEPPMSPDRFGFWPTGSQGSPLAEVLSHGSSTQRRLPADRQQTTIEAADLDLSTSNWLLKKKVAGSKSFEQPVEVVEGCSVLRIGRRDSVVASSNNSTNTSPASSLASPRRWAAKAEEVSSSLEGEGVAVQPAHLSATSKNTCTRSCSADHLGAIVDILGVPSDAPLLPENRRRLILSAEKRSRRRGRRPLAEAGKSRSLDTEDDGCVDTRTLIKGCDGNVSSKPCTTCRLADKTKDLALNSEMFHVVSGSEDDSDAAPLLPEASPRTQRKFETVRSLLERARSRLGRNQKNSSSSSDEALRSRSRDQLESAPGSPVHTRRMNGKLRVPEGPPVSHSSPNTPLMDRRLNTKRHQSFSPVRTLLSSPLLRRKKASFDSSEEDVTDHHHRINDKSCRPPQSGYQNLETFQKQKLRQKLRELSYPDGGQDWCTPDSSPRPGRKNTRVSGLGWRELVLHNKAPLWNESSQVYQLDFGGRVTQESAKNFQIEYLGKQVMQFGRIDSNAYTLDFQYPFTAVQAFSVALANVTQRLK